MSRPRLAPVSRAALAALVGLAACGGGSKPKHPESGVGPSADDVTYPAGSMSAPASDAEKVLGALRPKIRRCYEDALKSDPKVEGVVRMQIKVGPDGEVTGAKRVGDTSLPASVLACIAEHLQSAKFAPPGPGGSTFEIPLSFTRKEE